MKRCLFITFLTLFMIMTSQTVFADESDNGNTTSQSINLKASVPACYTVKIPNSLNVSLDNSEFVIRIKGDIGGDDQVLITLPSKIMLSKVSDVENESEPLEVSVFSRVENGNKDNIFLFEDISSDYNNKGDCHVSLTCQNMNLNGWFGSLPIDVRYKTKVA